jgi:hypothetical protein
MGSVAFSFRSENCISPRWQISELKGSFSRYFLRFPVSFWKERKIANIVCEALGFKRKQKRRVFRLCYNNLILIPRQLFKLPLLCMSMGSRALKKSSNWRSKNLNEKSFVRCCIEINMKKFWIDTSIWRNFFMQHFFSQSVSLFYVLISGAVNKYTYSVL